MYNFPIGVMVESFKLPFREAIERASALGAKGIQMYATTGEMTPGNLSEQRIKEILDIVKSNGMVFSALCGDFGGLSDTERNEERVERLKRVMELALKLETNIVTTHIGVVPVDNTHPRYGIMQDACYTLAEFADSLNSHFAIETGPETAANLRGFLDSLNSRGVAVNLDPANFVMVTGDDPVEAVYTLKDYIVHTHAKDGIKLLDVRPELIYGAEKATEEEAWGKAFEEVPLGKGNVDFDNYLRALEAIGYKGFLTIEREVGENPAADIKTAFDFLTKKIKEN